MFVRITDDITVKKDEIVSIKGYASENSLSYGKDVDTGKRSVTITIETKDDVHYVAEFSDVSNYSKTIQTFLTYLTTCLNRDYDDLRVQDKWEWVS